MIIELKKIRPLFLESEKITGSSLWENEHKFESGDWIEIVAPSGRGKSSLIHFLYGIKTDYEGSILMDHQDIKKDSTASASSRRSKKLSIVFQDLKLFESHTCFENISVKHALHPYDKENTVERMANRLGVKNKLNAISGKCSYGERQRIAIIRALQQPFEFILLDEPFSHLDSHNSKLALELIIEESEKRKAGIILADLETNPLFPATKRMQL